MARLVMEFEGIAQSERVGELVVAHGPRIVLSNIAGQDQPVVPRRTNGRERLPIDRVAKMQVTDSKKSHVPPQPSRGESAGTRLESVGTALDPHTVRVRWLVVEARDTPHLARWRSMLDPEELARADRYHFAADRNIYTAAHALARFMLSEATCLSTRTWRYVTGEFGKPALAAEFSKWNLHFNISHTRGLAACAIASQEVGVDVERSHRSIDLGIARHYFAPEEVRILSSAAQANKPTSSSASGR